MNHEIAPHASPSDNAANDATYSSDRPKSGHQPSEREKSRVRPAGGTPPPPTVKSSAGAAPVRTLLPPDRKRLPLPGGLPASFLDPEEGRTRLTRFLGIANRRQQERIIRQVRAHVPDIWSSDLKELHTADRQREVLLRFYRIPEQRVALWRAGIEVGDENHGGIPPSLEYEALLAYAPDLSDRPLEEARVEAALADFPGIVDSLFGPPPWQDLALAVLPDLRDNVRNWGTLTPERRQTVPLAIFAVATLLEDARLLQWAGRAVEAIGDEFAPLLDAMETGGDPSGSGLDSAAEVAINPAGQATVLAPWVDACHMVADTAAILAEDPRQPRRLKRLREQVRALDAVRGPAAAGLEAHDLMGGVRDQVAAVLDITGADWLRPAIRQIDAQWRLACLTREKIDPAAFRKDLKRLRKDLNDAAGSWRKAEDRKVAVRDELLGLYKAGETANDVNAETDGLSGVQARVEADARAAELLEQIVAATREAGAASNRCLDVAGPEGQRFDAGRDYIAEWNALRVRPVEGPVGGPEADTVSAAAEERALARATEAESDLADAVRRVETARAQEEQALAHAAEVEAERDHLRHRIRDLEGKLARLTEPSGKEAPPSFEPLPSSWAAFGPWVEEKLPGRLTLAPLARRGVKDPEFRHIEQAARCLVWLATDYRDRRRQGGGNSRVPVLEGFYNEPCGEADLPFSPMKWNGRNVGIEWHIKNGGNTRDRARCLRIYYFWDADAEQVVVACMPAHARTNLT